MTDDRPKAAEQIATLKRLAKEAFELEELCALPQFGRLLKEKELELVDEASVKRHGASCGLDLLPQCSHKGWSWTKNSLMSEVWRVGVDRILVPQSTVFLGNLVARKSFNRVSHVLQIRCAISSTFCRWRVTTDVVQECVANLSAATDKFEGMSPSMIG
jgi:hypothetical protein